MVSQYFVSFLVLQSSQSVLLYLCYVLNVMSLLSFLVPWVGLQHVIVAFSGHTHLLFDLTVGFNCFLTFTMVNGTLASILMVAKLKSFCGLFN